MSHKQRGWLITILIVLVTVLTAWGSLSHAGELDAWDFRFFGINYKDFEGREPLPAIGGAVSSFVVHELGHIVAGRLVGMDTTFHFNDMEAWADDYIDKSDDQKAFYHAGGFIAQALVGTTLTVIPKTRHSDFTLGFNSFTAVNSVIYGITGGTDNDSSDVANLDKYGYNGEMVAFITGGYTGVLAYINLDKD